MDEQTNRRIDGGWENSFVKVCIHVPDRVGGLCGLVDD